jgi:hypothetical protein
LAPLAVQGGAVSVLGYFCYRLVQTLLAQSNTNADRWQRVAEAADKRADESVRLLGEVLTALQEIRVLVRASSRDVT